MRHALSDPIRRPTRAATAVGQRRCRVRARAPRAAARASRAALALALSLALLAAVARPPAVGGWPLDDASVRAPSGASGTGSAPAEVELIGGYRYDRAGDTKCPDCLNGAWEWYGDRVRRWADDCQRGGHPACATREAAERDSVERLYSEFMAAKQDWADSGFLDAPAMAASRHHCPDYWAGRASGCVAGGAGTGGGDGGGGLDGLNPFAALSPEAIFKAAFETISRLFVRSIAAGLGEIAGALGADPARLADLSLPPALTYDSRAVRGLHDLARLLAWGFLLLAAIAAGLRVMGLRRREIAEGDTYEELERLALCAVLAACCWWPLTLAIRCANALMGAFASGAPLLAARPDAAGQTTLQLLLTCAYLVAALGLIVALYLRCARLMLLLVVAPLVAVCEVIPGAGWLARLWARQFAQVLLAGVVQTIALRTGAAVVEEAVALGGDAGLARLILGVVLVWFTFGAPALLTGYVDRHESRLLGFAAGFALRSATRGLAGGGGGAGRSGAPRSPAGGGGSVGGGPGRPPAGPGPAGSGPGGGGGAALPGLAATGGNGQPARAAHAGPASSGLAPAGGATTATLQLADGDAGDDPEGDSRPAPGGWPRGGGGAPIAAHFGASSRAAAYEAERGRALPGSADYDRATRALREAEGERERSWQGVAGGGGAGGATRSGAAPGAAGAR